MADVNNSTGDSLFDEALRLGLAVNLEQAPFVRLLPQEAVRAVQSGQRVYIHPGAAEPEELVKALVARAAELRNVEIIHLLTLGEAGYVRPGLEGSFRHNAMFVGSNVREAVNSGRADFVPISLSEVSGLFNPGQLPIDLCLIQVSPPDEHGFCSFGVGVDCTKAACEAARVIVAEFNESHGSGRRGGTGVRRAY